MVHTPGSRRCTRTSLLALALENSTRQIYCMHKPGQNSRSRLAAVYSVHKSGNLQRVYSMHKAAREYGLRTAVPCTHLGKSTAASFVERSNASLQSHSGPRFLFTHFSHIPPTGIFGRLSVSRLAYALVQHVARVTDPAYWSSQPHTSCPLAREVSEDVPA